MANLAALAISQRSARPVQFMVGVSTTNLRGQTSAQSMAETELNCGHQSLHRDYANDTFTNFDLSQRRISYDIPTQTSYRTTHVSWNPDLVLLAAGNTTEIAKNNTWLDTIPTWHRVILNPCHEADEYQGDRTYGSNYATFRAGLRVLCDLIHARNNPNWQTCLLLTAYAWKGSSGASRDPENFWPGSGYIDIMGVDMYNEGSLAATRWDSPGASLGFPADKAEAALMQSVYSSYRYGGFLPWCESKGITKYVVGEVGSMRNIEGLNPSWIQDKGITNTKADWIREFGRFHADYTRHSGHQAKCVGIEYFMSAGRQYNGPDLTTATHDIYNANTGVLIQSGYVESWQLWWNQADYDAWRDVTTAYGLPN